MVNFKKLVALGMVTAMVMGSTVTSFADDPAPGDPAEQTTAAAAAVTGAGSNIYVNKQVYKAKLPTAGAVADLAYKVDVQGLVAETVADGVEVEEGAGILFANSATKYSSISNPVTITNMSSIPISVSVAAVLTEGTTNKYEGGYSTSIDFTKDNADKTAGIFLGVIGSTETEYQALSTTSATVATVIPSAAQFYETKETSGTYTYDLPSDVSNIEFPEYEMTVTGAINRDVAESAFATVAADNTVTVKAMPTVSLTFTPAAIKDWKEAVVVVDGGTNFYVRKATGTDEDGGFGTTKPSAATINGKTIDVSKMGANADGHALFTWKDFYTAYGYAKEEDIPDADALYGMLNSLKFTMGTGDTAVDYYVELQ